MHLKITHIAGQSNADVRNLVSAYTTPKNHRTGWVLHWGLNRSPLVWKANYVGSQEHDATAKFGIEVELAKKLLNTSGGRPAIIQAGVGSTDLASDWLPPSGTNWTNYLSTVNTALTHLTNAGFTYEHSNFIWIQGERDAQDESKAEAYAANLQTLVNAVINEFGNGLLFFFIKLGITAIADVPLTYASYINNAFDSLAAINNNMYAINSDAATLIDEASDVHYDKDGFIELVNQMDSIGFN